ncbi:hypothetical protein DAPPUDRAFT_245623 [Daphnia pulex]|uniref:Retrotransposon gag domain-containing protein n=1 Tax=Daphnia pulex TaxID=6669 RepID=E9GNP9_DAPPU|nr:hypothetical protein DAPPUDRAFT_245623 [Daphnia pulex]|eukprot:EFX78921.1 hypothetical protein DAPPUDRAFT_245623 [Daphnia pulex]
MYFTEFKNCIRNSEESIRDYACRLQKLYSFAYPTEVGKPVDQAVLRLRETMLMDGFLGGLKPNLRERMSFKDYKNLDDLIKATEKCAAELVRRGEIGKTKCRDCQCHLSQRQCPGD